MLYVFNYTLTGLSNLSGGNENCSKREVESECSGWVINKSSLRVCDMRQSVKSAKDITH